jgi:diguanylate cyclase (GGDEF)-like protein
MDRPLTRARGGPRLCRTDFVTILAGAVGHSGSRAFLAQAVASAPQTQSDAVAAEATERRRARSEMSRAPAGSGSATRRRGDSAAQSYARRFGDGLRTGDPATANAAVDDAVEAGFSGTAVHSRVIAPAMHWIGTLWERGVLSVADEHLATAISYQALSRLYPGLLRRSARAERRVVVAAIHGEHHVLGLRMAADALDGAGYDVRFLGADVPGVSLQQWMLEHKPAVLALGVTMPLGARTLVRQIEGIHAFDPGVRLVVGGQGVPRSLRDVPGLTYAPDTEGLAAAVDCALEAPRPLRLPARAGGGQVVRAAFTSDFSTSDGIGTFEARMAGATAAAADGARAQARRAFTLEQLAFRDALTELWNRRAFDDRYQELLAAGKAPVLLMIDVDRFKGINDTLGHDAGDRALIGLARCMTRTLRPDDFLARYGGDEFAVLLPDTTTVDALTVGERIRRAVEKELADPPVSISIGVTATDREDRRRGTLDVDRALYEAKQSGRNRVALATQGA